ncbi:MAG: hypothetical protein V3U75_07705 [Methylococcaceae bacterium]
MKNYSLALFNLILLLYGCEDSSTQKTATLAVEEKPLNAITHHDAKPPQSDTESNSEKTNHNQYQKTLDLSVPFTIPETNHSDYISTNVKPSYLPDLFNNQTGQKNKSIQIVGKMINGDKELLGKKILDGAGFDVKLAH